MRKIAPDFTKVHIARNREFRFRPTPPIRMTGYQLDSWLSVMPIWGARNDR